MSQPVARAVPPHSLRPKGGPLVGRLPSVQDIPRVSSRRPNIRSPQSIPSSTSSGSGDALTPQATAALIRRVLCPSSNSGGLTSPRPWSEQLPRLTSDDGLDEQLYAIVAIVLKEFVHTWYGKITPDHEFTDEAVRIISHCTIQLEARSRVVDWVEVLGNDLPALIDRHIADYSTSCDSSRHSPFATTQTAYHALNRHPALEVAGEDDANLLTMPRTNEVVYRQLLVQSVLALLLPSDDLKNPTLRILIADIVADLVLGNAIFGRLCEGWMIWESIYKAVVVARAHGNRQQVDSSSEPSGGPETTIEATTATAVDEGSLLERSGLLEIVSGGANVDEARHQDTPRTTKLPAFALRFLALINHCIVALAFVSWTLKGMYAAALLPTRTYTIRQVEIGRESGQRQSNTPSVRRASSRNTINQKAPPDAEQESSVVDSVLPTGVAADRPISAVEQAPESANGSIYRNIAVSSNDGAQKKQKKKPILLYAAFGLLDRLMQLSSRLPWLSSALEMARYHLILGASRVGDTNGAIDKFLYHQISARITSSVIKSTLIALRVAIFPNNSLASTKTVPLPEEQLAIRRQTAEMIISCLPSQVIDVYLGEKRGGIDDATEAIEGILDMFSDSYCNKHLMLGIVDLLIIKLLPEIEDGTAEHLLDKGINGS